MTTRRILGKAVLGLAAALPLMIGAAAQSQDNVSLRLNWYLGGLHVPFYYGVDRGFYKEEGINLTINEGRGSANTVQVVGAVGLIGQALLCRHIAHALQDQVPGLWMQGQHGAILKGASVVVGLALLTYVARATPAANI